MTIAYDEFLAALAAETDPRRIDLMTWGTHYVREERCECCAAPLVLQEYTSPPSMSPDDTCLRWMEIVSDGGNGPGPAWIIRDHGRERCHELRRSQ